MARPPAQKNVLLWLCTNLTLQTDRTTTFTGYSTDLPEANDWGPYLVSVRPLTITRNRSANFQWKPDPPGASARANLVYARPPPNPPRRGGPRTTRLRRGY